MPCRIPLPGLAYASTMACENLPRQRHARLATARRDGGEGRRKGEGKSEREGREAKSLAWYGAKEYTLEKHQKILQGRTTAVLQRSGPPLCCGAQSAEARTPLLTRHGGFKTNHVEPEPTFPPPPTTPPSAAYPLSPAARATRAHCCPYFWLCGSSAARPTRPRCRPAAGGGSVASHRQCATLRAHAMAPAPSMSSESFAASAKEALLPSE